MDTMARAGISEESEQKKIDEQTRRLLEDFKKRVLGPRPSHKQLLEEDLPPAALALLERSLAVKVRAQGLAMNKDVPEVVWHGLRAYMKSILCELIKISRRRCDLAKYSLNYTVHTEPRRALQQLQQRDEQLAEQERLQHQRELLAANERLQKKKKDQLTREELKMREDAKRVAEQERRRRDKQDQDRAALEAAGGAVPAFMRAAARNNASAGSSSSSSSGGANGSAMPGSENLYASLAPNLRAGSSMAVSSPQAARPVPLTTQLMRTEVARRIQPDDVLFLLQHRSRTTKSKLLWRLFAQRKEPS